MIQWFPGHMAKARREVIEKLKYVDIVYEVLDARIPLSSRNPMLEHIIDQKPHLIFLNKVDLADPLKTKAWADYFEEQGQSVVLLNAKDHKGFQEIIPKSKSLLSHKFKKYTRIGLTPPPIKGMCIGIPNVGKSTILNRLVRKNIAKTGNKPGVTKGQQWLRSSKELELLDTPGILWPKFEDEMVGKKLALLGSIKDDILPIEEVALFGLSYLKEYYPKLLQNYYELTDEQLTFTSSDLYIYLTEKKGFSEDFERMGILLLSDIRQGKLGRMTFDDIDHLSS